MDRLKFCLLRRDARLHFLGRRGSLSLSDVLPAWARGRLHCYRIDAPLLQCSPIWCSGAPLHYPALPPGGDRSQAPQSPAPWLSSPPQIRAAPCAPLKARARGTRARESSGDRRLISCKQLRKLNWGSFFFSWTDDAPTYVCTSPIRDCIGPWGPCIGSWGPRTTPL
jgi:hypothetical protein